MSAPTARFVDFGLGDTPGEAQFVLAGSTHDTVCAESVFVGPVPLLLAEEAWTELERAYGYSGGTFTVFARLDVDRPDLDALRATATLVMQQRTFYSNAPPVRLERYVVLARAPDGIVLDPQRALPTFPSAAAARRGRAAHGDGALALVALQSVWWHTHM